MAALQVVPAGRCVDCHMPRVAVDSGRHVWLSDHWIRVRGPSDPPAADAKAAASARPDDRGGR